MKNGAITVLYSSLLLILTCVLPVHHAHASNASVENYSLTTNIDLTSDIRFAVIGDFGNEQPGVGDVADLIDSWDTDFIITVGDNRYGSRSYDQAVGQFYCSYLRNAGSGAYCQGGSSITNDFYPALGNHDYSDFGGLNEYLKYFTLPGIDDIRSWTSGSERYYDFIRGPVHFFVLDSQASLESALEEKIQMDWLKSELALSTTPWQVVYFHHPPYSSGLKHGSNILMRWPFAAWGAEAVISGHDHLYERIHANGIVYFVNGLGGASSYGFESPIGGSQFRYNSEYGAMIIDADNADMIFQFINTYGEVIDTHTISEPSLPGIIDVWIENSFDDVEQSLTDGTMYMDSSDIELGNDSASFGDQAEGLRFQNIIIPQGARITKAYLEFVVDEVGSSPTKVEIRAEDTDDAPEFSTDIFDVTDRTMTSASVSWDIPAWEAVDDIHQSPDLSAIVQEVTGRAGWTAYNSMAFTITGSGTRTAESWDGESASAARLHIEYSTSTPTNIPPSASFMVSTSDLTAYFKDTSSDSDGTIVKWSWSFGDGTRSSTQNPSHTYAAGGTYPVSLTVTDNDGDFSTASQRVTVTDPMPTNIPPVARFMVSTSKLTADFKDRSLDSDGTIVNWSWKFGDGTASSRQNPSHTYAAGGTYRVSLTVTDNDGDFSTASQRLTVTAPPRSPSGLTASSESSSKIKLRWRDNADNESGFTIERSLNSSMWTTIASVGPDIQAFSNTRLKPGMTYYYRVLAYNSEGTSPPSNIARAKTDPIDTIHIYDMDGVSVHKKKKGKHKKRKWTATVTITVHNSSGEPVSGAKVSGKWSGGAKGNKSCKTSDNGKCSVTKKNIKLKKKSVLFTIKKIDHRSSVYDSESNSIESIKIERPQKLNIGSKK